MLKKIMGLFIAIGFLFFVIFLYIHTLSSIDAKSSKIYSPETFGEIDDVIYVDSNYVWSYDETNDLQLPELPTGCEATACSTLLRLNGYNVSKFDIADALPKSEDVKNFLYKFIGDPYKEDGWSIASPGVASVANLFIDTRTDEVVAIRGKNLSEMPTPSEVWVTVNLVEPQFTDISDDGFHLYHNSHAVVVTTINEDYVQVIDPLVGLTSYEREKFEDIYNKCGKQIVTIRKNQPSIL